MEKNEVVEVLKWFSDMGVSDVLETGFSRPPSNKISTLEELKEAMAKVDISIKHCATNMVFGMGNTKADVLLLGEAPGAEEDKQGLPFVGQSGQLLDKVLAAVGLDRTKVYITNILPWRPPGNRTPNTQEVALFRPYVLKHISLINPKVVVCLGGTSTKALLQTTEGIMKLHGRWTTTEGISAKIMPTFHPAYLLRSPSQKREFWRDFLIIREEILTD
ncbi:MAG: uracil-DNA glycosylase [Alphaproteobacteria bacterium]|nr:uracil-DNA glycosylase [Alphaproteobacteria bacterium]